MAVPDFSTLMRPCLVALAEHGRRSSQELRDDVAHALGVTDEERQELSPSGHHTTYTNRTAWALVHLRMAGLVSTPGRGQYEITARGRDLLVQHEGRLDSNVLSRYPEYAEYMAKVRGKPVTAAPATKPATPPAIEQTPSDAITAIINASHAAVATDLLARVYAQPPAFLERTALALIKAMGYGGLDATFDHVGGPGDKGLDGIVVLDALGLDRIGVQTKRYDPARRGIPETDVQAFVGALDGISAQRGVFVTTATFTKAALDYAASRTAKRVILIDGANLTRLMLRYGVGVREQERFVLLEPDEDFFAD